MYLYYKWCSNFFRGCRFWLFFVKSFYAKFVIRRGIVEDLMLGVLSRILSSVCRRVKWTRGRENRPVASRTVVKDARLFRVN
jgi:hypothetical protein